ncbi:choice-of-anchor P family protein [Nocardioides ginsengisoli]|uniref:Choice-of-anchor P family protein n=1 Tax=Nocardioides ginsengisoli TaxID=363868 RepID=A0ABW3VV73_9ACTN
MSRFRLLLAGGIAASMVPMAAGPGASPAAAAPKPAYGGFSSSAWSAPIRVEIYEPSLPIPASPQVEMEAGYTKVKADSGQSTGRASFFWPGDPVGEGLKTFAEQLGLPSNPLTDGGYPVQVNSQYPGDTPTQSDEKLPGSVMRTTSGDKTATAEAGFSPDGAVAGPDADEGAAPGGGLGGGGNPLTDLLGKLTGGLGGLGGQKKTATSTPGLPPGLAALVDVDGYVSSSKMTAVDGPVVTASRATLGEIRLLGGLITLGGVETVAKATSDGAKGTATGKAVWGKMAIAGQEFGIGPDGVIAMGKTTPIPGLKDLPAAALQQLGVTFEIPEPVRTVEGDTATSVSEGLKITIDTKVLSPLLKALPAAQLAQLIPAQAGPLKGIVAGLSGLAPRVVITLGVASATVDTVPPIDIAPAPAAGAPAAGTPPPASGKPAAGSVGVPPAAGPAPVGGAPTGGETPQAMPDTKPTSAGLPPLGSVPGMLMVGGLILAAVAGSWMRRLGVLALGGGAACPHGLDSGLPDLRKA